MILCPQRKSETIIAIRFAFFCSGARIKPISAYKASELPLIGFPSQRLIAFHICRFSKLVVNISPSNKKLFSSQLNVLYLTKLPLLFNIQIVSSKNVPFINSKHLRNFTERIIILNVVFLNYAGVAQLVVHFTRNEGVGSSNLLTSIMFLGEVPKFG